MKSVIFQTTGDWQQVLEEKESVIDEPKENEVQVQISCRPVNPSDEMFIQGVYRKNPLLPQIAGLEGAGFIRKCGPGVDAAYLNSRVMFRAKGTWAEYINLSIDDVRLVPSDIPFQVACQLSLNTLTAYALLETAQVKEGDHVLLTAAASSVGQQIIQLARERSIKTIALVREEQQLQKLQRLGATYVVPTEKQALLSFLDQNNIKGVQASLDAVGGALGTALIKAAAPFSRIIIYGRLSPNPVHFNNGDIIYRNLTIAAFGIDAWMDTKSKNELDTIWKEIFRAIADQSLKVHHDKVFPLREFKKAIQSYKAGEGRILLAD